MHYRAEKKPLPAIEGEIDLCKALADKNEYAMLATGALGLPQMCPVEDVSCNVIINKHHSRVLMRHFSRYAMNLKCRPSSLNIPISFHAGEKYCKVVMFLLFSFLHFLFNS